MDVAAIRAMTDELLAQQRAEDAEQEIRAALMRFPADQELRHQLAHTLLLQGRYREGFREYESRFHRAKCPARQAPYPEWDGPLAGRSILVWGEQGIGDEIMMGRYIRTLRDLGASRITLACWPQAVRAFHQLGADHVVGKLGQVSVDQHDCWISALSLPYRLGLELSDISGQPYLTAEPRQRGGIGLVERGNPGNARDHLRSLPTGLLQEAVPHGRLLEPEGDVYDSLCRLAGLDLLITVDTSWAHMAGALGVPCWVLLPHSGLDWRWMRQSSSTPWYHSLRLFRQRARRDWTGLIHDVTAALKQAGQ